MIVYYFLWGLLQMAFWLTLITVAPYWVGKYSYVLIAYLQDGRRKTLREQVADLNADSDNIKYLALWMVGMVTSLVLGILLVTAYFLGRP
jgi:hypothetical protein